MKKNAIIITFAAALCALTSCSKEVGSLPDMAVSPADSETVQNNATVYNGFKSSAVNGNVYTSEYAGIKITLPEDANFLDVDNLHTHYIMPTRFMSEDEKSFYMTGELDASACYGGKQS